MSSDTPSSPLSAPVIRELLASVSTSTSFLFLYSIRSKSVVLSSGNALQVLGVKEEALLREGNLFLRYVPPKERFVIMQALERALKGESPYCVTYRWIRPDNNSERRLACHAALHHDDGDGFLAGVITDLSSLVSGTLDDSQDTEAFARVLASLPLPFCVLNRDLRISHLSHACAPLMGALAELDVRVQDLLVGHLFPSIFSRRDHRAAVQSAIDAILEGDEDYQSTLLATEGACPITLEVFPLGGSASTSGCILVFRENLPLGGSRERTLLPTDPTGLQSIVAGVLHHVNNSLQAIVGEAALLMNSSGGPASAQASASRISELAEGAAKLGRELLMFDPGGPTQVDVNLAAITALHRLSDLTAQGLSLEVAFGGISKIAGSHQAIVEVIELAIRYYRLSAPQVRQITLRTYMREVASGETQSLYVGPQVKLNISPSLVAPLSTSASPLSPALASSASIPASLMRAMKSIGGGISLEATAPLGLSLTLSFPSHSPAPSRITHEPASLAPRVLIIDDDPLVLDTVSSILHRSNLPCVGAVDLQGAVAAVRAHHDSLELALVDAIIPGDEGAAIIRKIKLLHPTLIFVGFSGAAPQYTQRLLDAGAVQVIQKPANPSVILESIAQLLQSPKAA